MTSFAAKGRLWIEIGLQLLAFWATLVGAAACVAFLLAPRAIGGLVAAMVVILVGLSLAISTLLLAMCVLAMAWLYVRMYGPFSCRASLLCARCSADLTAELASPPFGAGSRSLWFCPECGAALDAEPLLEPKPKPSPWDDLLA